MKILHVGLESPDVRRGGLNNFLAALSSAQVANGDDVDVIQVGTGLPATANWLQRWRGVARCVRRSDATIIDVHFAAMAWWAVLSGALRGRPLVVHFQGPWAEESQWTGQRGLVVRVKKSIERSVLRRADRVITLSHAFATTAISSYGVSPARVEVLPPGVPARTDVTRDDARKHLGISPDAPVMVSVRRLVPRMGLHHAIAALVVLEDWTLAIAGTGPALEDLRQCAQDQGVADRVVFVGSVTEQQKQWWMAAANVCVVPSVAHEGFGLVVGESLAMGTPVAVAPVDGLRDAARLLPGVVEMASHDAHDLAVAVHRASSLDIDTDSLDEWSWSSVARRTIGIYEQAASPSPALCVVLDHTAQLSGGELALCRLVSAMDRHRWRVHVILATDGPLRGELESAGASVEVVALDESLRSLSRYDVERVASPWRMVSYCVRLSRRLRTLDPSVVVANSLKAIVYGSAASRRGTPFVAYVRDSWSEPYLSRRVTRALRALMALRADAIIGNSPETLAEAGSGVSLPSPVDVRCVEVPALTDGNATLRIALIGRVAAWKGQEFVLDALEGVTDIPWRLVIAGDALFGESEYRESLLERVDRNERVEFRGHVADVSSILAGCDVVINGSLSREPFGNVIVEAMAAGRIVIAPHDAGASALVEPGVNGILYERANVESLRAAVYEAWTQRDQWAAWSTEARRRASAYLPSRIAPQFEALLDEVSQ